jgi:two-component system CheB/CheR fusion protein
VAIILSGTGTDGSLGIKAIKGNDGLVLVQSEESADYNGMPRSAIGTGLADMVLPPGEMPARLIQYFAHPHVAVIHAPPLQAADSGKTDIAQLTRRAILERFTPTALLVDDSGVILYVHGRTGKYLETTSGAPTDDVLNLAREGLRIELSSALRAAKTSGKTVLRRSVAVKTNGDVQTIDLHVFPLADPLELAGRFLVFFEDTEPPPPAAGNGAQAPNPESKRIAALEKELQNTRESHQTTIEELESSKEELQSLNEELQTVNAELQNKVEELSASHDDMRNLLNSTEIATIFVDNDLHVRRFTPKATAIINLIPADIGRPLKHVVSNLAREGMLDDLNKVLTSLAPRSREVQTTTGQWFKMNIIPYRTRDNRIGGAVLTFASIDDQKQVQQRLMDASESSHEMTRAWQLVRSVFDMIIDPLAVLDSEGRIDIANTAFT